MIKHNTTKIIKHNATKMIKHNNTKIIKHNTTEMIKPSKGVRKYYISTLGVGGGSEGNSYFVYVVSGDGGSRGKMLIWLM